MENFPSTEETMKYEYPLWKFNEVELEMLLREFDPQNALEAEVQGCDRGRKIGLHIPCLRFLRTPKMAAAVMAKMREIEALRVQPYRPPTLQQPQQRANDQDQARGDMGDLGGRMGGMAISSNVSAANQPAATGTPPPPTRDPTSQPQPTNDPPVFKTPALPVAKKTTIAKNKATAPPSRHSTPKPQPSSSSHPVALDEQDLPVASPARKKKIAKRKSTVPASDAASEFPSSEIPSSDQSPRQPRARTPKPQPSTGPALVEAQKQPVASSSARKTSMDRSTPQPSYDLAEFDEQELPWLDCPPTRKTSMERKIIKNKPAATASDAAKTPRPSRIPIPQPQPSYDAGLVAAQQLLGARTPAKKTTAKSKPTGGAASKTPGKASGSTAKPSSTKKEQKQKAKLAALPSRAAVPAPTAKPSPFYEPILTLLEPQRLPAAYPPTGTRNKARSCEFSLSAEQYTQLSSRAHDEFPRTEVQLRFFNTTDDIAGTEQPDAYPPECEVYVNGKFVSLPRSKPVKCGGDVLMVRASQPVNITTDTNGMTTPQSMRVDWLADNRQWAFAVYLVTHLSPEILRNRIVESPECALPCEATVAAIKTRLSAGADDDEIAMDSLKISLLCPLMKTRIGIAARSRDCDHLQCFDLDSYLNMNEKKGAWMCGVCGKAAPYERLVIDKYFMKMLQELGPSATDVELLKDGNYRVIDEGDRGCELKREASGSAGGPPPAKKAAFDEITIDDDDEEGTQASTSATEQQKDIKEEDGGADDADEMPPQA